MVHTCALINCKEKFRKGGVSFYSFPKDKVLRKKWLVALGQSNIHPGEHAKLCSKHFTEDCFEIAPWSHMKMLRPESVPTIFVLEKHAERSCNKNVQNGDVTDFRPPELICAVKYCRNKVQSHCDRLLNFTSFFHFPKRESIRSKWLYCCGLENSGINLDKAVICDIHFRPEDFVDECNSTSASFTQRKLSSSAVPSRFLRTENTNLAGAITAYTVTQHFKESLQDKFNALIVKKQNPPNHSNCDKAADVTNEKLFNDSSALSVMRRNKIVTESKSSCHTQENTPDALTPHGIQNVMLPTRVSKVCFICDEPVLLQTVPLRYGQTHFSSTALPTKLGQLMGEGFMVVVADSDVLCTRCFGLLNHLDKMELEVDVIQKVLHGFLKSKYHLNQIYSGLALDSLQMLDDQLDETAKRGRAAEKCKSGLVEQTVAKSDSANKIATSVAQHSKINMSSKLLKGVDSCEKTNQPECDEVRTKRVKFSENFVGLSDDEHDDWGAGDMQGHIIVVHDYSDCEMTDDGDDDGEFFMEKQVYGCIACGYEDTSKDAYEAHLHQHMNNNYYKCNVCYRKFGTKELLDKHAQRHKNM